MTASRSASSRPGMLSLVIACALPVLIFLGYSQWHFAGVSKRATLELMEASADSLASAVSQEVERTVALLQVVGASHQMGLSDTQFLQLASNLSVSVGPGTWVALLSKDLRPLALTRELPAAVIEVYKAQALRAMNSLRPQLARVSGISMRYHNQVLLAVPLFRQEDGEVKGVALMGVPHDTFEQQLTHNVLPKGWRAVLNEDEHNHVVTRASAKSHPWSDRPLFGASPPENLLVVRKVSGTPWHIDVTVPVAAVHAETWQDLAPDFVAGTIFLLLAALVGSAAARRLARPMAELAALARKLSDEASGREALTARAGDADSVASALQLLFSRGKEARLELVRANDALRHLTQTLEHRVEERTLALERAKKSAEQVSKEKTDFLSQLRQDVKVPLASLLEIVDLLLGETDNLAARARLTLIRHGAEALDVQLRDLLEMATLDVDALQLQHEVFAPAVMLQEVTQLFESSVNQKSNVLNVQSSELPRHVRGDAHRLAQVLRSLITYLGKLSSGRAIRVRGWGAPEGGVLHFSVSDSGRAHSDGDASGEAERETLPRIPVDSSAPSLSVCRRLVEAMGGSLHIESTVDEGTRFHFYVAMATVSEPPFCADALRAPAAQLKGHVLVADDNALNRVLAEAVLSRWGLTVEGVEDGKQAVERVLAQHFDAVLLDLQMPEVDGFEAARRIRMMNERGPLLVALSADSARLSRYDGPKLFDDFFAKPTEWSAVLARLRGVLGEGDSYDRPAQTLSEEQYEVLEPTRQEELTQQMGLLRLKPFLQALPTGLTAQVQQVVQAHVRSDYAVMAAAAHGLAEAAQFAGCIRLAQAARVLPHLRENADLAQLQWVLSDTLRAIQRWGSGPDEKRPNLRLVK